MASDNIDKIINYLSKNGVKLDDENNSSTYLLDIEKAFQFITFAKNELVSIIGADVYYKHKKGFDIGDYFYLAWSCESGLGFELGTKWYFEKSLEIAYGNLKKIKTESERMNVPLYIGFVYEKN